MAYPGNPQIPPHNSDFNYAQWVAGTRVSLVNVPWNNDYRDITNKDFDINAYIDSIENAGIVVTDASYAKLSEPIRLDIPFNRAIKYNYLRASNPLQPIEGDEQRDFYYFILAVNYLAPNTTEFVLQLDIWQSFKNSVTFGNCYVERGHVGIANTKNFDNYGRDYLTVPEGVDVGSDMQVIARRNVSIMDIDGYNGLDDFSSTVLVASATDLKAYPGTVAAPELHSAPGGIFNRLPSGASYYVFEGATNFYLWMDAMKVYPWVTQGILSITMIPKPERYGLTAEYEGINAAVAPTGRPRMIKHSLFSNWRASSEILNAIPERYHHLKKFLTSPYMGIELTTFTGTPIGLKPEAWADADCSVIERAALVPPNQRVSISPFKYNAKPGSPTDDAHPVVVPGDPNVGGDDYGDYLDVATLIANFPTLAIVNNNAVGYMASNAHSLAFQHSQADWSQQRALRGNEVSYDQASGAISAATKQAYNSINADALNTMNSNLVGAQHGALQSGKDLVTGIGLGGATRGAPGAIAGAAGGGVNALLSAAQNQISQQGANNAFAIRKSAAEQANRINAGQAGFVRDTNKDLGDWAAKGDYESTVAGINAKVQDAKLIQPSTVGQVGGESMNLIHGKFGFSARWKMIDLASITIIGEYWLRYGYAVRRFAKPKANMQVMSKFTYWKLTETYLTGALPEQFKQAIRGIFEKGVTVWQSPADIGNIDIANNTPLGGITL